MQINKKIVIITVIVVFLISLIVSLSLYFSSKSNDEVENNNLRNVNSNKATLPVTDKTKKVITEIKDIDITTIRKVSNNEADIKNSAIFVAENMGSYSIDTYDYINLRNSKLLSTNKMKVYIDNLISSYQKNNQNNNPYYGVTTKALSVEILTPETIESGGPVEVVISTQRIETTEEDTLVTSTKYKKMDAELIKNNDKWLVDSAKWQ
jgi:hypothetical protein